MAEFTFNGLKLTAEGKKYMDELKKLKSMEICCGFQRGEDPYADGTDLVTVAAYNELGTSNTPARPFMKQSWENHERELKAVCQQALTDISNGGTADRAAAMIGAVGVGIIQQEIVEGEFAPNAPSTIKKKGSDRPLVDTGHMRQSVHYVVRKV